VATKNATDVNEPADCPGIADPVLFVQSGFLSFENFT
jgi:hypothetical protein